MHRDTLVAEAPISITGRSFTLPDGPIFHLQRAGEADYEIGAFRRWAGYKNLGADVATQELLHFQHVLSFSSSETTGRTGVHCHLAHAHIVIPTSGRGVFSYDGVDTVAAPGAVIVQHGGTIHDQFEYSYSGVPDAENTRTPQSVDPAPSGAPVRSFGFLELFVPRIIADVEIIPPAAVTMADQLTTWGHPYHTPGARFSLQNAGDLGAAYRPVATAAGLEARDADTWAPSGSLVATWIIRPAVAANAGVPVTLGVDGESGGLEILYMMTGSARFPRDAGEEVVLEAGDTLTLRQGDVGLPFDYSADMRLIRIFIAAKAQSLRQRTAAEIEALEALGPAIITHREVRPEGDRRPINFLARDNAAAKQG